MTTEEAVTVGEEKAQASKQLKILLVSSTVFPIPLAGYGGLEQIVYHLAVGMHERGHKVTVMAPSGSKLPEGVELIECVPNEAEEAVYTRYRQRMEAGEWDVIHDHSWQAWPYMSAIGREPILPILHTCHGVPSVYGKPPPMTTPCFVGLSDQHCNDIRMQLGIDARRCYNGLDLSFYTVKPEVKRNGRYLFLGRYTAEKGPLVAINLARRLQFALDTIGDVSIVASKEYVDRCRTLCDGVNVRFIAGISREQTVAFYQQNKALLNTLTWSEPFGLTTVEAMACGMGVLTLERGSMRELVEDGVSGYVFKNEDHLAQGIKDNLVAKIDPMAARKVAERFSLKAMCDGYEELYYDVAAGRRW